MFGAVHLIRLVSQVFAAAQNNNKNSSNLLKWAVTRNTSKIVRPNEIWVHLRLRSYLWTEADVEHLPVFTNGVVEIECWILMFPDSSCCVQIAETFKSRKLFW